MVKRGIRGGVDMTSTQYGNVNNEYMGDTQPSTFLPYLDANNLYGWVISKPLQTHGEGARFDLILASLVSITDQEFLQVLITSK